MGFRENLKAELLFRDIRVKELSAKSGIKKMTLDGYLRENGYTPSVEAAFRIADALKVSVEYLVTGREAAPGQSPESAGPDRREKEAHRGRLLSSLKPDLLRMVKVVEVLPDTDRRIVVKNALNLSEALKNR
ncbi:MAG: helix-turn-helix transcriptional regulator [Treponematales bacterium]